MLGYCLQYALADPPYGIAYKLKTARLVEFLRCFDKPQVALVDEVREAKSLVLVLFCYTHHKTQIGSCQFVKSLMVAFANLLCEFYLLFHREQFLVTYLLQVFV